MRARHIVVLLLLLVPMISMPMLVGGTMPQVSLLYQGNPGSECHIEVTVANNDNDVLTVWNVTVVLLFPFPLDSEFFSDQNITYSMFLGEKQIQPGASFVFEKDSSMPDWDIPSLQAKAVMNYSQGSEDHVSLVTYSFVQAYEGNEGFGPSFDVNLWYLFPFVVFFGVLGGFALSYFQERPYWDLWIKERIDQKGSNVLIKWRWIVFRWVDEGKAGLVIAIYVGVALFLAILAMLFVMGMP